MRRLRASRKHNKCTEKYEHRWGFGLLRYGSSAPEDDWRSTHAYLVSSASEYAVARDSAGGSGDFADCSGGSASSGPALVG